MAHDADEELETIGFLRAPNVFKLRLCSEIVPEPLPLLDVGQDISWGPQDVPFQPTSSNQVSLASFGVECSETGIDYFGSRNEFTKQLLQLVMGIEMRRDTCGKYVHFERVPSLVHPMTSKCGAKKFDIQRSLPVQFFDVGVEKITVDDESVEAGPHQIHVSTPITFWMVFTIKSW